MERGQRCNVCRAREHIELIRQKTCDGKKMFENTFSGVFFFSAAHACWWWCRGFCLVSSSCYRYPAQQAWLEMVDLSKEIKVRGRKPAFGPMSATRNRRLLSKALEDEETETAEAFQVLLYALSYPGEIVDLLRYSRRSLSRWLQYIILLSLLCFRREMLERFMKFPTVLVFVVVLAGCIVCFLPGGSFEGRRRAHEGSLASGRKEEEKSR